MKKKKKKKEERREREREREKKKKKKKKSKWSNCNNLKVWGVKYHFLNVGVKSPNELIYSS
jgi:hypothetical protein